MDNKQTWLDIIPPPKMIANLSLRDYVKKIAEGGGGSHSGKGETLRLTIKRLEAAGISYQLTAHPGYGYYIQGIPKEDWMK